MTQVMRDRYKSTFMMLLVVALSSIAMAQESKVSSKNNHQTPPRNGQQKNLYEALKTHHIPSTIHAVDLTADWNVITVLPYARATKYYTTGDTLLFGGQEYLIAYQLQKSSDADQREAQQYYESSTTLTKQGRTTPMLLKESVLSLSLFSFRQNKSIQQLKRFDPRKDVAAGPPKTLIARRISQANLKQIGQAMLMYMQDYDDKMPPMVTARSADDIGTPIPGTITAATPMQNLILPYVKNREILLQPTTHRPYLPNYRASQLTKNQIHNAMQLWSQAQYAYGVRNNVSASQRDTLSRQFLFYEDAPDADGMRNVLYADGHVDAIRERTFQYQRKAQGISESGYPPVVKPTQKAKATPKT